MTLAYIISFSNTIGPTRWIQSLDMRWKWKDLSFAASLHPHRVLPDVRDASPTDLSEDMRKAHSIISFIKTCKHFFSSTFNHTWEVWKVIWILHAWQLSIKAIISPWFLFSLREYDWFELPCVTCAAFQSKATQSQICDPELFKAYLHNCYCTCDCDSREFLRFTPQKGFYLWTLQQFFSQNIQVTV